MKISRNKWKNYKRMLKDAKLSEYLPDTRRFSEESLWEFMDTYGQVMIKPVLGYKGRGIIQLTSNVENVYHIQIKHRNETIQGRRGAYERLLDEMNPKRSYIVQQKIPLALIDDSPFDIRIMLQRISKTSRWHITGRLIKVAVKGFVVTNIAKEILPLGEGLRRSSLSHLYQVELVKQIERISLHTANRLGACYPKARMIGLDIALDEQGNPWIIEANFRPSVAVFDRLEDKSMYHKIKRFRRKARKKRKKKNL